MTSLATRAAETRADFEDALRSLLREHGAVDDDTLVAHVRGAVDGMLEAMDATSRDGTSLSALDVVRIRAGKLAAVQLPPALWRDARQLASLRAALHALAARWLGSEATAGSRFAAAPRGRP
jgi:hypothetical protein